MNNVAVKGKNQKFLIKMLKRKVLIWHGYNYEQRHYQNLQEFTIRDKCKYLSLAISNNESRIIEKDFATTKLSMAES